MPQSAGQRRHKRLVVGRLRPQIVAGMSHDELRPCRAGAGQSVERQEQTDAIRPPRYADHQRRSPHLLPGERLRHGSQKPLFQHTSLFAKGIHAPHCASRRAQRRNPSPSRGVGPHSPPWLNSHCEKMAGPSGRVDKRH